MAENEVKTRRPQGLHPSNIGKVVTIKSTERRTDVGSLEEGLLRPSTQATVVGVLEAYLYTVASSKFHIRLKGDGSVGTAFDTATHHIVVEPYNVSR